MRSAERQRIGEAVKAVRDVPFSGLVWRAHLHIPQVTPLTPTTEASARWNLGTKLYPDRAFQVLYTALREGAAVAEVTRHIEDIPPDLRPQYALSQVMVELSRVLDIRDSMKTIGVDAGALERDWDYEVPQMIGEAAYECGFEGILAPSLTKLGDVLVVLTQRRLPTSQLHVLSTESLNLGRIPLPSR